MHDGQNLLILGAASLAASAISACFSVGGGYVLFGALTWIMPLPTAIAMQSVLSFGSLVSRTHAFWAEIDWTIVRNFTAGTLVGVGAGLWLFARTPERVLAVLLGLLLFVLAWAPAIRWRGRAGASYFGVGIAHAVVSTLFGLGAILQPVLLRSSLARTAIVGTFATCIILLETIRTLGYAATGFSYAAWWPEILVATVTGLAGTYLGKRMVPVISEDHFRFVMRLFITLLGLRFVQKGLA
ncbi:TSUP family transporter [Sphingomonas canadensis]|uniref:Probable membrane transporter protein n=1 Tax=Sphingomonas canadensis TaxID=1219257 RepID=A0ABW3H886_9SPHN|nr:sulfite exporter TauE/SafE family protein [Sphingomonas canadensis]MCW3834438.1 sulfite exporter TauE/SafE family protein [Sphingomonas canadensis]